MNDIAPDERAGGKLVNVRSHLTAEQCNALKSSKITDYFQNAETNERGAADSKTDSGEVILVD